MRQHTYKPTPIKYRHPGVLIKKLMEFDYNMNLDKFSKFTGIRQLHLKQILDGDIGINREVAKKLGDAKVGTEQHWLNYQAKYVETNNLSSCNTTPITPKSSVNNASKNKPSGNNFNM